MPNCDPLDRFFYQYSCKILIIHALRIGVELPSPTDSGYENDTDTGHNLPKIVSQPLDPLEWLMILFVSVKTFVAITVFVRQRNNPILKLSIVQELIEFVRILTTSQISQLQQKIL